jgi:hypothetical protein
VKGCALSALSSFLAWAAIVAGIGAGLYRWYGVAPFEGAGVAVFAGLFVWVAGSLLISAARAWGERATIAAGIAGTPPVDGRQTILAGHIEPAGAPLTSPLSGRECVVYTFEIYEMRGSGKSRFKAALCDGVALVPSIIVTPSGSYRLLAVPELVCNASVLEHDRALARAGALMRALPMEPKREGLSRPEIEKQWADDDGAYRRERRHVAEDVRLGRCTMIEHVIESGSRVCVFGEYSAARRAIVADPNDWSKITRIMKGDPDAIARQLRGSVFRRLIGATLSAAAAAGLIAAFVSSLG